MSPTLAIVFVTAAALIFVPLAVASDLWTRARNRGRLPSLPAMVTIALALASSLHNISFVYRSTMAGGDGLSGLNVVLALWSTMGIVILWAALLTRRVRLYRAMGATIVPSTARVYPSQTHARATAASAQQISRGTSARVTRQDPATIVRLVYRDDPAPGVPCAAPLAMMRMPPTLRDIVRAGPAVPADMSPDVSVAGMAQIDARDVSLPHDIMATRAPAARFASRPMAAALRNSDRGGAHVPGHADAAIPRFRSTRVWAPPAVC